MSAVLRVYTMPECEEWTGRMKRGPRPLDWDQCRTCGATGWIGTWERGRDNARCGTCGGHGSLKAAALAQLTTKPRDVKRAERARREYDRTGHPADSRALGEAEAWARQARWAPEGRCEDCAHPPSDGTWDGPAVEVMGDGLGQVSAERMVEEWLAQQEDPKRVRYNVDFWSPCDEGCRHGAPARWATGDGRWLGVLDSDTSPAILAAASYAVEASWRQVDVRPLSWAFDLRPENLAVLCLRCWVARG